MIFTTKEFQTHASKTTIGLISIQFNLNITRQKSLLPPPSPPNFPPNLSDPPGRFPSSQRVFRHSEHYPVPNFSNWSRLRKKAGILIGDRVLSRGFERREREGAMSFQDLEGGRPRRELINGKQQDSTQALASGIFQINTAVNTFRRLVNTLGTPKDTPALREKLHKSRLHIGQLVKYTSAKLKHTNEVDHHAGVSPGKKIADAKLAKDFQAVLTEFQKAQRVAAERETAYTSFVPQAVLPSSQTASEGDVSSDRSPEQRALFVDSRRQEVLLLDNEISFNEAIIEEREHGIQEIQNQIGEVNEIFKDLAVLVNEQGTMIDDISTHIDNAHAATAQGKSHLVKAAKTQRANSSLACLLLVIFGIVLLIVTIVLAA